MLAEALNVQTTLVRGGRGVFEVRVNQQVVTRKTLDGFPTEEQIVDAVRDALGSSLPT